jgi:hypothetical protein
MLVGKQLLFLLFLAFLFRLASRFASSKKKNSAIAVIFHFKQRQTNEASVQRLIPARP